MPRVAIRSVGLGKKYRVGRRRASTFRDAFGEALARLKARGKQADESEVWALRDVSFEVNEGEVVGVIGRNGAGKSTLLKILSRVTEPTEGRVELYGRVGSLLEVGTGFHPDLTGRENVFLSGAILGMSRAEVVRKFDEIVAFAEVEKFIDTQVKHFSSGMYMRLAFAVAAHLDPEILLVDEVLAVGDASFQKKCLGRMGDIARGGRTVLFVSHNIAAVENLCSRGLLLAGGAVATEGSIAVVLEQYVRPGLQECPVRHRKDRHGDGAIRIQSIAVRGGDEESGGPPRPAGPASIGIELVATARLNRRVLSISIQTARGQVLSTFHSDESGALFSMAEGRNRVLVQFERLPLMPGDYLIDVAVGDEYNVLSHDHVLDAVRFGVIEGDPFGFGRLRRHHSAPVLPFVSWSHSAPVVEPETE